MDTGLLLIRCVVGLLLVGHGTQKLFGWFGGYGLAGVGGWFHSIGHRPGRLMALAAGLSEAGGGLLLAVGLLTPLAAAAVIGVMLVAASTHWPKIWVAEGGLELPLVYAVVGAALAFTGPGAVSLDRAFGWDLAGTGWGLFAVALGGLAATATIARAAAVRRSDAAAVAAARTEEPAAERIAA